MANGWTTSSEGSVTGSLNSESDFEDFMDNGDPTPAATDPVPDPVEVPEKVKEPEVKPVRIDTGTIGSEEEFTDEFGEEPVAPVDEETGEQKPAPKAETPATSVTIDAKFLEAKAKELAQRYGIELEDDIEWTDENYMKFEEHIIEERVAARYEEVRGTSPQLEALFELAENGGNINELLEVFSQQREVAEIDGSTPEGKLEAIRRFHKEVKGQSPQWVEKYVKRLQLSDDPADIEEEYTMAQEGHKQHFDTLAQKKVEASEKARIQKEQLAASRKANFAQSLKAQNYKEEDVNKFTEFVYNENRFKDTATGNTYSAFDVAILEAKKDPAKLADVVLFLSNKDLYNKKIIQAASTAKVESTFRKTLDKASGASTNTPSAKDKPAPQGGGFKFQIK